MSHTLSAEGADASEDGTGRGTPLVTAWTERTRADGRHVETQEGVAYSLNSSTRGGRTQENRIAVDMTVRRLTPTECARLQGFPDMYTCLCGVGDEYRETLRDHAGAQDRHLDALSHSRWSRDWETRRIPDEVINLCRCPDSPQYQAYGNAVTVNVVEYLGDRLLQVMRS